MAQTNLLIDTLKRTLKMRRLHYRDIARGLDISEASVKRMFSTRSCSLERLDKICEIAQISLVDLVKQMDNDMRSLEELTEEQEQQLTSDPGLLLVAFLIINGLHYEEIMNYYTFKSHELIRHLARLDRLKVIELLPNNRFHLRVSPHFSWRKNGPIQKFFTNNLQNDFLDHRFEQEDETLMFLSGALTSASNGTLQKRIEELARDFNQHSRDDMQQPLERRRLTSMILAIRPWRPDTFEKYRRK